MKSVIRTYKFALKVKSQKTWDVLKKFSRAALAAYNHAALLVTGDDRHRQNNIDEKFELWKKDHPVEAVEYDAQMEKYNQYRELIKLAKRDKCPWPEEVKYPKRPVKIKSDVKKSIPVKVIKQMWYERRENTDAAYLGENSQQIIISTVGAARSATIKRRTENQCASMPGVKPDYAHHPFYLYRGQYRIENDNGRWSLLLRTPKMEGCEWIRIRFFPTRKFFNPDQVVSLQIGKTRYTNKWYVCFSMRIPVDARILRDRTVGVDINSGTGNTIVVVDRHGEIFRRVIPGSLEKIQRKIEKLQHRMNLILNANEENYKTRNVKKLKRWIRNLYAKAANIRKNSLHHFSKEVVLAGNKVALEDLDVKQLTKSAKGTIGNPGKNVARKADRNRKMLSVAPGMFRDMVTYKSHGLEASTMVVVDPAYTSLLCCYCGEKGLRYGKKFRCVNRSCAHFDVVRDADENGGMNCVRKADAGEGEIIEKPPEKTKIGKAQDKRKKNFEAAQAAKAAEVVEFIPAAVESVAVAL